MLSFSSNLNNFFFQIDQLAFSKGASSNAFSFVVSYFCVLRSWLEACCKMPGEGGERRWVKACTGPTARLCCTEPVRTCAGRASGATLQQRLPCQKPWHGSQSPHGIFRPYSSAFYPIQLSKAFTGKKQTSHVSSGFRFPYKFKNDIHCDLLMFANLLRKIDWDSMIWKCGKGVVLQVILNDIWILDLLILIFQFGLVWSLIMLCLAHKDK